MTLGMQDVCFLCQVYLLANIIFCGLKMYSGSELLGKIPSGKIITYHYASGITEIIHTGIHCVSSWLMRPL